MGCCCSCLFGDESSAGRRGLVRGLEAELTNHSGKHSSNGSVASDGGGKSLCISRAMSAPTIDVIDGTKASGYGLVLAGASVEQDAAYWEAQIMETTGETVEMKFGVATKKTQRFYSALEESGEEGSSKESGTDLMSSIRVKDGDRIGIAVQQDDLPMVQFLLNGEPVHDAKVNRFRGTVYPAIYLPENEGLSVELQFNESEWKELPPSARFGPLIISRGLI